MSLLKIKDGFLGEQQINVPREIIINKLKIQPFSNNLFITHIGFFPKAKFHYRERALGCSDNILLYCVDGSGHYETANESYVLNANQFMLLPPGKFHIYQADLHNPWSIYWVHFSGKNLRHLNDLFQTENYLQPTNINYDEKIIDQWREMYNALDNGFSDKNLAFANLCLYKFLTFFLCPQQISSSQKKEDPVGESLNFMKANIDKIISVDDLADKLKYSNSHFTALFKSKTGSSPIEYFIKLKIQYACQLLTQTHFKIKVIADKIGYEDSFYFSRIFKKMTGKSPKEYRLEVNSKKNEIVIEPSKG